MWGASVRTADAIQIALALMLATSLVRLGQSGAAFELRAAALAAESPLGTPYVLDYALILRCRMVRGKLFSFVALRQGFSTFSICRALRGRCKGIIVWPPCGVTI